MNEPKSAEWAEAELGNLAEFRNGVNYTKDNFGHGVKIINVKDFKDYSVPKYLELDEINPKGIVSERNLLRENDIVFVRSNGNKDLIGRSIMILSPPAEAITHSAFSIRARITSDQVVPRYMGYVLRSGLIRQTLSARGSGTNISNLNQDILARLKIPLPPLETQRRIASILSAYDDLIENNTRRIEILEEMARRLYDEWFVHFRFPGHESTTFTEGEHGLAPEGWKVNALGSLLSKHIGGGWGKEEVDDQHSVPGYVIRGTDIPGARTLSLENCPHRYHKPANIKSRQLIAGDIVMEVSGGGHDQSVGRPLLITDHLLKAFDDDVICASFCKRLQVNREQILPFVLYLYLKREYDEGNMDEFQVQSTGIKNFQFKPYLEQAIVFNAPMETQRTFVDVAAPLMDLHQTLSMKNSNLRAQRDLLLPKLVSGEIDLSVAKEPLEEAVA